MASLHTRTWIVVDDDEDDRMIVRAALKQAHAKELPEIIELENGLDLIRFLQTRWSPSTATPFFIIMDVNMPLMKGNEALRIMQDHATWKQIPVVIMSTSVDPDLAKESVQAGAKAFWVKSCSYMSFLTQLQELLTSVYSSQLLN